MKKVLFVASVPGHFKAFHLPYFKWFKSKGMEVHTISNNVNSILPFSDKDWNVEIQRNPFSFKNIKAYKKLKKIIKSEKFDLIHCHTPVASIMVRLAAINERKKGTKVIYTAHGFHFFKGSPKINWLIYYPIEKFLSKFTDVLITINEEDYHLAITKKFKAKQIVKVNGVGTSPDKFIETNDLIKKNLRKEYGFSDISFILFYAAELSIRKNHSIIIETIPILRKHIPDILFLFAGTGPLLKTHLKRVNELGVDKNVKFLGFRSDINKLIALSDVGISSSKQEGLPVNIMEVMSSGLPVIGTNCRGNNELIKNNKTGLIFTNKEELKEAILKIYNSPEIKKELGNNAKEFIKKYSLDSTLNEYSKIYSQFL